MKFYYLAYKHMSGEIRPCSVRGYMEYERAIAEIERVVVGLSKRDVVKQLKDAHSPHASRITSSPRVGEFFIAEEEL